MHGHFFAHFVACAWRVAASSLALAMVACVATPEVVKMEPRSFAKRLGLHGCRASTPLSREEVIEIGRKWELYPNPQQDPGWIKMTSIQRPGDELRLISCRSTGAYYYALIRMDSIVFSYQPPVLD